MENSNELDELNDVICEMRRCIALFYDETETNLEVDEFNDDFMIVTNIDTGNKFKVTVEKIK